jgi:peptidoglycan/LPS O-acetylase OafA/YrhL
MKDRQPIGKPAARGAGTNQGGTGTPNAERRTLNAEVTGKPARYEGLDMLRGLAAFVVVLIHTQALPNDDVKAMLLDLLPPANAVFAIMAGFFMLEGLRKRAEAGVWLTSRFQRLVLPYLLWTAFYILLNMVFDALSHKPSSFMSSDWRFWRDVLLCGQGATHLWFLPTLFYAQCFLFLVWITGRKRLSEEPLSAFCAGVGACVLCAYPLIETPYLRKVAFMAGYVFLGGVPIIVAPFLAAQRSRLIRLVAVVLLGLGVLRLLAGYGTHIVLDMLRAVSWVLLARAVWFRVPVKLLASAGDCSMGIYLIHIVFVAGAPVLLRAVGVLAAGSSQTLAVAVAAFLASWGAVHGLRKLRVPGM